MPLTRRDPPPQSRSTPTASPAGGLRALVDAAFRAVSPEHIAVRQRGVLPRVMSYGELDAASAALADGLAGTNRPVGLVLGRGAAALTAQLACIRAGRAFFAVAPDRDAGQLLRDAGVSELITGADVPHWWSGQPVHRITDATLVAARDGVGAGRLPPEPSCGYLLSTSGTTGAPKVVRGSASGLARYLCWQRSELAVDSSDVLSNTADPWFDFSFKETLGAFVSGASITVAEPSDLTNGHTLLRWMADAKPSVVCLLPSRLSELVEAMRREPDVANAVVGRLRLLLVSGEPFPVTLLRRWQALGPRPTVLNLYGPTESTVIKLRYQVGPDSALDGETVPVGLPIPGTVVELVSYGAETELCLMADDCDDFALGYLHESVGSTRFERGVNGRRRLLTGDLARWTAHGEVELLGRADHTVKRRGVKVQLPGVEAAALRHPDVTAAVAVWCPGEPDGRIVLFYRPAQGAEVTPRSVRAALLDRVLPDQLPDQVRPLADWPLDARGKVDRLALRAMVTRR